MRYFYLPETMHMSERLLEQNLSISPTSFDERPSDG